MNLQEIKKIAKEKGIKAGNIKKPDLIRTIQTAEGNIDCYGSATSGFCDQTNCLRREDCLVYSTN
jgi:hypothetical protein